MNFEDINFKAIIDNARIGADDFIDIFIENKVSTVLSNESKRLEKAIKGLIVGAGIRLISNKKTYYAYTNNIEESNLLDIASLLRKAALSDIKKNKENENVNSKNSQNLVLNFNEKKPKIDFNIIKDVTEVSIDEKLNKILPIVEYSWKYDKKVVQVNITYSDYKQDVLIINSEGDLVKDYRENLAFLVNIVVSDGNKTEVGYESAGGFTGFEFFDDKDPQTIAKKALDRALSQLSAPFAPSGPMMVVLSSEAGGTMIHEAIGHGLEADIAGNDLSVYSNKIGEQVASRLITVLDDSSLVGKRGFYRFDDEGTYSRKNILVEDGVLKKYMSDRLSYIKYGYGRRTG